ncbi:MAG: MBL fold metallo-hydrolase [Thermodesulfobacteriota bacterium]|nr:MBL fold metallo-hydrolase [Thermodesulfobacteriota bacterium]
MRIKWYGHASFLIESEKGTKIITDPYQPGGYDGAIKYGKIPDIADIALISHSHPDHDYPQGLSGSPEQIKKAGVSMSSGITFCGMETFHDTSEGKERGENIIFTFEMDGLNVCHLGDLGHPLSPGQVEEIGAVDILFIPVGGFFTIDADEAKRIVNIIKPKITVPMHFKTEKVDFPIEKVDGFVKDLKEVKRLKESEIEINKNNLPEEPAVIVLNHAL